MFFALILEKGILDFIAHGLIIRVFTVLKRPFLHYLVIFKDFVNYLHIICYNMLSTGLLMQRQIFADSHRHCAMREGGEDGYHI